MPSLRPAVRHPGQSVAAAAPNSRRVLYVRPRPPPPGACASRAGPPWPRRRIAEGPVADPRGPAARPPHSGPEASRPAPARRRPRAAPLHRTSATSTTRPWSRPSPARSQAALAEAYRRHGGAVWALAKRVCRDEHLAEDVTQTVFVELWSRADRFDSTRGSLRSYLLTQAHARAVDLVRSEEARRRRQDREAAPRRRHRRARHVGLRGGDGRVGPPGGRHPPGGGTPTDPPRLLRRPDLP